MASQTTWVVLADGASARFLTRAKPELPLVELADLALTAAAEQRLHGQVTAVHDGVNHGHQVRLAHENLQNEGERHFLSHVAGRINLAVEEHAVGQIIIWAPPRALGVLRDHLAAGARRLVKAEIAKDILRETPREIDERLRGKGL